MKAVNKKYETKTLLEHIFMENPVLAGGLVIGQLAAGSVSLQSGAALSITFLFITLPVLVFASAVGKYLPKVISLLCYMVISAMMLMPSYLVVRNISNTVIENVGIYLPLLAVTTIPVAYSSKFSERHGVKVAFIDAIGLSLGFSFIALLLGGIRELFGNGTLWGDRVFAFYFPSLLLPFWGFIIMGLLAAALSGIKSLFGREDKEGFTVREEDEE